MPTGAVGGPWLWLEAGGAVHSLLRMPRGSALRCDGQLGPGACRSGCGFGGGRGAGYSGMLLLALFPPLWFWIMNPRVKAARAQYEACRAKGVDVKDRLLKGQPLLG